MLTARTNFVTKLICQYIQLTNTFGQSIAESAKHKLPMTQKGERVILIVDDEPDIVRVLSRALQTSGFTNTVSFTEPEKAFEYFVANHEHICIVVLDVRMPSMSGIDFARRVRSLTPAKRILLITAYEIYGNSDLRNAMRELSITGCIKKPASMQQLCSLVESYCRSSLTERL